MEVFRKVRRNYVVAILQERSSLSNLSESRISSDITKVENTLTIINRIVKGRRVICLITSNELKRNKTKRRNL